MIWLWLILGLFALLLIVLFTKMLLFKPKKEEKFEPSSFEINREEVTNHLAEMVKCKTVSSNDKSLVDENEFARFRELLKTLYPVIHSKATLSRVGNTGLLYFLKGASSSKPTVLMSHYDVVTAAEEYWEKAPFEGIIEDDTLWGRGTLDTKGTLCGIMESLEALIKDGFVPKNDLYLAFSGDEEIAGPSAPAIVQELKKRNVTPAMVVDEGGAVVEKVFPGVSSPTALVGTAEKGMMDLKLTVKSKGGHASAPPPHTPVGVLADAITKIEGKPFKFTLTPPVKSLFDTLGRHSTFLYKLIFANLWLFSPVLDLLCKVSGGEINAMMRTTCAFTMMQGSNASNVLPPVASVVANLRIIGGMTYEDAITRLKKIVKNDDIEFEVMHAMNPSTSSSTEGDGYMILTEAISKTWPNALISPYLMFACSDSRHYHEISNYVYRFSAMQLTNEQRSYIHGHNERITIDNLVKIVEFYLNLVSNC